MRAIGAALVVSGCLGWFDGPTAAAGADAFGAAMDATQPAQAEPSRIVVAVEMDDAAVTGRAARIIRTELDRVWAPHGVRFVWPRDASELNSGCFAVKVVFTENDPGLARTARRKPLGIVYRVGTYMRRVIFVSPSAVMSLVRKSAAEAPLDSMIVAALHARMMGRVIAHELGHIMFDSEDHTPKGLMRSRFRPRDVTLNDPSRWALQPAAVEGVAQRCTALSAGF